MKQRSGYWVALLLAGAVVVLVLDPIPYESQVAGAVLVAPKFTDPAPVRQPKLQPTYAVAGYTYRCSDCHRIIPSPAETVRKLGQHTDIELRHGINTRCFNCHHPKERDAFVDDAGGVIPWTQPQLLCGKCHGPVYRDWLAGSHGRVNGYWDRTRGEQTKRRCIECHDPHHPPFQALEPAPGPNTLRMGMPYFPAHDGIRDPLRLDLSEAGHSGGHEQ
jgi:hypothetical protein